MSTDYKETLNLPHTDFAMKANLSVRENDIIKQWETIELYQQLEEKRKEKKEDNTHSFILADGPPYANGPIHIGHALNKILKDFVLKSKRFSGFHAPYVPGWDCHGLPIELNVEKKFGKPGIDIDPTLFRKKCRDYVLEQIEIQKAAFIRLGVLGDWQKPYLTMDYRYEADILRAMAKIIEGGHVEPGYKPVHWCSACGSALAEAEVEYADKVSMAIDVGFQVVEGLEKVFENSAALKILQKPVFVVIWTTTPWTLPANQAVCVHPDYEYVLIRGMNVAADYIVAAALVDSFTARLNLGSVEILDRCQGHALSILLLQHPFYDKQVPLILGEHVTLDAGTGCVHTAPSHGQEDYQVGLRYHLSSESLVDSKGCFLNEVPLVGGQFVFKANEVVVKILEEKGTLLHQTNIEHSYPHCWRHHTPLIFRATAQWFISMEKAGLREDALKAIAGVQWLPSWGEARITAMIQQRPDWCISRQRTWGVPLAFFVDKEKGSLHPRTVELLEIIAQQVEQQGIDAWQNLDLQTLLGADASKYEQCTHTVEVWFDSGVSHYCVLEQDPRLHEPADLYLEGSDQHRGWFQSSLLTAVAMNGRAPYKQVLTHGFTVDEQGRKMSKSLGNVIDPQKVIDQYGADILRLWVSSVDYTKEIVISDALLKHTADIYRRIRNTVRFLLSNLYDFDPSKDKIPLGQCLDLDRYIVEHAATIQASLSRAFESYDFNAVYQKIHYFCAVDLGGFYLDIIKDRLYTCKADGVPRRSAQTAMYHIIEALVRWIAPILSFTAEEIWQHMPGRSVPSVFLTEWYTGFCDFKPAIDSFKDFWPQILSVRQEVNKSLEEARKAGIIGSALEAIVEIKIDLESELAKILETLGEELRFVWISSEARLKPLNDRCSEDRQSAIPGLWIRVIASTDPKCERCWHRCSDLNSQTEYPGICGRCVENIACEGEKRLYA